MTSSRFRAARESWLDELEYCAIVLAITSETSRSTLTSVMSSAWAASPFRRTIFGLPLWQGSTNCQFSPTMPTSIKCLDLNESVGDRLNQCFDFDGAVRQRCWKDRNEAKRQTSNQQRIFRSRWPGHRTLRKVRTCSISRDGTRSRFLGAPAAIR